MKKRGFTLAEVLITLGIVGVVAALTAPALIMSSRNEANAARLSVVVSNLENAFQTAIAQEGADNLYGTSLWDFGGNTKLTADCGTKDKPASDEEKEKNKGTIAQFVGRLGQYMIINGYVDSDDKYYGSIPVHPMSESGGTGTTSIINDSRFWGNGQMFALETKNGAAIFMRAYRRTGLADAKANAIAAGSSYYTNAADIVIDVNGKNAPNTFGRDIFWFQLGENGVMYPYGGADTNRVDSDSKHGTWDSTTNVVASCSDDFKGSDATKRGIGCAARVIADGYKINY